MDLSCVAAERGLRDPPRLVMDGAGREPQVQAAGQGEQAACLDEVQGDVYESLPASVSVRTHMMAGSVAGVLEHSLMFPIDSVKTRMQSLQPDPKAQYKNVFDALQKIMHTEGFWRPLRGLNAMVVGAGPAHAMYFACYEKMKRTLSDAINHGGNSHLANGI